MSNDLASPHDADVTLIAGTVKYASRIGPIPCLSMQTMGERIKILREAKNLSQADLGQIVGVSRAAVSLWELGNSKNIKNVTMLRLVEALGTSQEYLLFGPRTEREEARRQQREK